MNPKFGFALALILCAACKKEEPPPAPVTETPPAAPAAEPPKAADVAPSVDAENLPVEEDFEDEAEKEVTAANVNQKLDELEKEIAAE